MVVCGVFGLIFFCGVRLYGIFMVVGRIKLFVFLRILGIFIVLLLCFGGIVVVLLVFFFMICWVFVMWGCVGGCGFIGVDFWMW